MESNWWKQITANHSRILDLAILAHDLPPPSHADLQQFIDEDPVHGPQLKLVRQSGTVAMTGAAIVGAAGTGYVAKVGRGFGPVAAITFPLGAMAGGLLADTIFAWTRGTYKFDMMTANEKFTEWWYLKNRGK